MQFLTISRRRTEEYEEANFLPRLEEEAQRARALYLSGSIRQIWRRGDVPGACLLVEAENISNVQEMLQTLPLVKANMLEISAIIPLSPYPGFGPRV